MSQSQYQRLLIAGAESEFGAQLSAEFEALSLYEIHRAPSLRIAAAEIRGLSYTAILVDNQIDRGEGIHLGSLIRKHQPSAFSFLLIDNPRWMARDSAKRNGFSDVLDSSQEPQKIAAAIAKWGEREGSELQNKLSSREIEIMRDLTLGSTTYEIAMKRHIAEATVKSHLTSIYRKLEVRNRVEAVTAFQRVD